MIVSHIEDMTEDRRKPDLGEPVERGGPMAKASPSAIDRHVGNRIAIRRVTIGMSQEILAGRLGLKLQEVQDCEKGRSRIGMRLLVEIAGVLGVNVRYFYTGLSDGSSPTDDPMATLLNSLEGEDE
jgi:ribosome-binding protein aMBF1 (putative translation factor)